MRYLDAAQITTTRADRGSNLKVCVPVSISRLGRFFDRVAPALILTPNLESGGSSVVAAFAAIGG
jgi:hypothetical protein